MAGVNENITEEISTGCTNEESDKQMLTINPRG